MWCGVGGGVRRKNGCDGVWMMDVVWCKVDGGCDVV